MTEIKRIGFIGLGTMGGAMATNLQKAGFSVCGFDPTPGAADGLVSAGGTAAASAAEAAEGAELVIMMVPDVPQIEGNLEGDNGLLSTPGDGRLLMVMCTIDPGAVRTIAERVQAEGRFVGRHADA